MGIILYEFVCGGVPFGEEDEDPFVVYEKILHESIRYPASLPKGNLTRQLIDTLLNKNPALRCVGGISKLKEQKYFFQFDWVLHIQEKLNLKQLSAPLVPQTKDLSDEVAHGAVRRGTLSSMLGVSPIAGRRTRRQFHRPGTAPGACRVGS